MPVLGALTHQIAAFDRAPIAIIWYGLSCCSKHGFPKWLTTSCLIYCPTHWTLTANIEVEPLLGGQTAHFRTLFSQNILFQVSLKGEKPTVIATKTYNEPESDAKTARETREAAVKLLLGF